MFAGFWGCTLRLGSTKSRVSLLVLLLFVGFCFYRWISGLSSILRQLWLIVLFWLGCWFRLEHWGWGWLCGVGLFEFVLFSDVLHLGLFGLVHNLLHHFSHSLSNKPTLLLRLLV